MTPTDDTPFDNNVELEFKQSVIAAVEASSPGEQRLMIEQLVDGRLKVVAHRQGATRLDTFIANQPTGFAAELEEMVRDDINDIKSVAGPGGKHASQTGNAPPSRQPVVNATDFVQKGAP